MIKEKIRNSLFLQLMIFAGCLILALFAGMILTLRYIGGTVRENIWSTNEKLTFQIETQMEENYLKMRNIATSIVYSPTVKKYLKQSETEKILHRNEIGSVFSNADLLEEDIKGISMYNASGKRIADYGMDISEIIGEETLLRDKMEYSNVCYLAETDIPYYLIYFPVFDLNNREYGQQIGMCIFLMKLDGLQQELEALKVTENTEIYLVDGDNRILKDGMEQKQLQIKMLTEDNRFYVNEQSVFMGKWKVLSRIPVSEVKGYKNSNI